MAQKSQAERIEATSKPTSPARPAAPRWPLLVTPRPSAPDEAAIALERARRAIGAM